MSDTLVEGLDYYIDGGKYVFTAHYLRTRGYCCNNNCRHCPYELEKSGEAETNRTTDANSSI